MPTRKSSEAGALTPEQEDERKTPAKADEPKPTDDSEQVDRPGFDLGGSTGETDAGKGLGLGTDAKEGRKGWRLPRGRSR